MKNLGGDYQLYAISAGSTVSLGGLTGAYLLLDYSGLGLAGVRRLTQRAPAQNGDTDIGHRVDSRTINLAWGVAGISPAYPMMALEEARQALFSVFRPRDYDPVKILFVTPGGQRRQIDVNLQNEFDHSSGSYEGVYSQRLVAQLVAGDSRFYDPTARSLSFDLSALSGGWNIEENGEVTSLGWSIGENGEATSDGWQIGVGALGVTQVLSYGDGSPLPAIEYPTIVLTGPLVNPIIQNVTTGEKLDFTASGGLIIPTGGTVTIDLRIGEKTIINDSGVFVDQYLSNDSDLSSWHLSFDTELLFDGSRSDGNNTLRVTGADATLATSVVVIWFNRYIGI